VSSSCPGGDALEEDAGGAPLVNDDGLVGLAGSNPSQTGTRLHSYGFELETTKPGVNRIIGPVRFGQFETKLCPGLGGLIS
jgi:hypothetical protein